MSDDANSLFGHTSGVIVSRWFINALVVRQIESFDGARDSRCDSNWVDLCLDSSVFRVFVIWLNTILSIEYLEFCQVALALRLAFISSIIKIGRVFDCLFWFEGFGVTDEDEEIEFWMAIVNWFTMLFIWACVFNGIFNDISLSK
jgi:hypothetical protein